MARDKGDESGKRRWGRGGKPEEGPSDEELGWLADLRGAGRQERGPFGDEPTGKVSRPGRREREVPPPPVSPAPAGPASPPPPTRGLRRTPPAPPPPPPPVVPPPSPPTPSARPTGPRPMMDWSDLTGELPTAAEPATRAPDSRSRGRTSDLRTGDIRAGRIDTPAAPPVRPGPEPVRGAGLRTEPMRPGPAIPPAGPPAGPGPSGPSIGSGPPAPVGPPPIGPGGLGGLAGMGGPGGPKPPLDALVTTGMIRRAELRKHLRIRQQLKVGTLVLVAVLLLAAYPLYLFTSAVAQDPVFSALDNLDVPSWANYEHSDAAEGSRWCIEKCRERKRTLASERAPEETSTAYATALTDAGWRPRTEGFCPQVADGVLTCWQKDEYVMDMYVRAPICDAPPPRPTIEGASPSAEPTAQSGPTKPACAAALVTMQVFNAIDYRAPA